MWFGYTDGVCVGGLVQTLLWGKCIIFFLLISKGEGRIYAAGIEASSNVCYGLHSLSMCTIINESCVHSHRREQTNLSPPDSLLLLDCSWELGYQ